MEIHGKIETGQPGYALSMFLKVLVNLSLNVPITKAFTKKGVLVVNVLHYVLASSCRC